MPVKYIGRTLQHKGKPLWDIVLNLKNFGIGRVVYRSRFQERYEGPSYYVLSRVEPDFSDYPNVIKGQAWGYRVFRGEHLGDTMIKKQTPKQDWVMVPKDEVVEFCKYDGPTRPKKLIPEQIPYPPLLERLIIQQKQFAGEEVTEKPMLPLKISRSHVKKAYQQRHLLAEQQTEGHGQSEERLS